MRCGFSRVSACSISSRYRTSLISKNSLYIKIFLVNGRGRTAKASGGDSAEGGYEASRGRRDPVTVITGFVHSYRRGSLEPRLLAPRGCRGLAGRRRAARPTSRKPLQCGLLPARRDASAGSVLTLPTCRRSTA